MRLVDADALGNRMYHESFEKDSDLQRWDGGCWIRYKLFEQVLRAAPTIDPTHPTPSKALGALDCVERQAAMKIRFSSGFDHDGILFVPYRDVKEHLKKLPSVQPEEAVPHRNYKYLSDFWCECGNHLGKKGDVKYCSDCGKKVKWDERFD